MAFSAPSKLTWAVLIAISACVLPDLDPAGRPCPCISGYTCETSTNKCVLGSGETGGASSSQSTSTSSSASGETATASTSSSSTSSTGSSGGGGGTGGGPPSGLVVDYPFEEGAGTTTADLSGNGFTGTLMNGPTWTAGHSGNALSFDGINDYVLGPSFTISGSMTISAWIYSAGQPPLSDDAAIISAHSVGGYQLDTTVDNGPRTIGFKLFTSLGADMDRYGATALALNQWYHIVGVYDAVQLTMDVYLNGQLDNGLLIGPVAGSQLSGNVPANIGRRPDAIGMYEFNGKIDELRLYNRALSAAEVLALYNL